MHRFEFRRLAAGLVLSTCLAPLAAHADQRLWNNEADLWSITKDSIVVTGAAPMDQELADDFRVTGEIRRAVVAGYDCWNCEGVFATGVRMHIYAKGADGKPADELYGFRLDASDPRFIHDLNQTGHNGTIDVTFPEPFIADGDYFLSVQLEYDRPAMWPLSSANHVSPFESPVQIRDNLAGTPWQQHEDLFGPSNFDFGFALYGLPPGPPPSNTVAECGEWSTELLPLPESAVATSVYATKTFGAEDAWLVGGYDTGTIGSFQTFSLAYHRVGEGAWEIVPTPSPDVCADSGNPNGCAQVWFNAIDGVAPDDVWAGGWRNGQTTDGFVGGQVFLAHWDGHEWTQIPAPVSTGSGSEIAGIKAVASDDVWFVGSWIADSGWQALALHWNGSSLELVETPFPVPGGTPGWSLSTADGVAANDLWAVGHGSDGDMSLAPYVLHWTGGTWDLTPDVPMPGDQIEFNSLLALGANDVYAAGSWFTGGDGYGPLIIHYDGSTWSIATQAGGGGPMITLGGGSVLALGNPTLYWNGTSWVPQPRLQDYDNYGFSSLAATGPCNAVGAAVVDIVGVRRSVAVTLKPIVFGSGFE
ncbi:MAG TPA: hypothetical protein VJ696_04060 [Rhodanobacteraceae bacterium]|nr:hypothetical protein [Rhodanobacteraceae bacterium]